MLIPQNLTDVKLGMEVENPLGYVWRVVRIVHQTTLFWNDKGVEEVEEDFIQLRNIKGEVDFRTYHTNATTYDGPDSHISGLPTLAWRRP
jgi:hypothetical protein